MKLKRFLSDNISLGKGAVKIPAAEMLDKYRAQFNETLKRGLKYPTNFYYLPKENCAIVHVKVPSETVKNFYYDVLIQFESDGRDFEDCHIKIFSNSPSFVYTYAYVFYHLLDDEKDTTNMIIDEYDKKIPKDRLLVAEEKLDKEILHGYPVVRNPYGLPLFDKTIYYAIFYIIDKFNFNRVIYNKRVISKKTLFASIQDFDTLMIMRKAAEDKQKESTVRKKKLDNPKEILKDAEEEQVASAKDKPVKRGVNTVKPIRHGNSGAVRKVAPISSKKR